MGFLSAVGFSTGARGAESDEDHHLRALAAVDAEDGEMPSSMASGDEATDDAQQQHSAPTGPRGRRTAAGVAVVLTAGAVVASAVALSGRSGGAIVAGVGSATLGLSAATGGHKARQCVKSACRESGGRDKDCCGANGATSCDTGYNHSIVKFSDEDLPKGFFQCSPMGGNTCCEPGEGEKASWFGHQFRGHESEQWCRTVGVKDGFEYKWFTEDSPCGKNSCCKREVYSAAAAGDGWIGHTFNSWESEAWCRWVGTREGWEYKWFGPDSPCGKEWCCKRPAKEPEEDVAAKTGRRGSFLVLGDWGYDEGVHYLAPACVHAIADKMKEMVRKLGDVKFVINVGDSFYPNGVSSKEDWQWQAKWRDVFSPEVRDMPWYSVYGNHDYHADPLVCSDDLNAGAQINADPNNLDFFQMPSYTYFKEFPELDMEIVGMDLNHYMDAWDKKKDPAEYEFSDCQWTSCKESCVWRMKARTNASMELFYERAAASKAKNLLVFSHYPTDYLNGVTPDLLNALKDNSTHDILYVAGHRHSTDQWSTTSIEPNENWLVGGGGGWGCDSDDQGFVVGEVLEDYSVRTYSVLVPKEVCCLMPKEAEV